MVCVYNSPGVRACLPPLYANKITLMMGLLIKIPSLVITKWSMCWRARKESGSSLFLSWLLILSAQKRSWMTLVSFQEHRKVVLIRATVKATAVSYIYPCDNTHSERGQVPFSCRTLATFSMISPFWGGPCGHYFRGITLYNMEEIHSAISLCNSRIFICVIRRFVVILPYFMVAVTTSFTKSHARLDNM